jgi:hypothetical protein
MRPWPPATGRTEARFGRNDWVRRPGGNRLVVSSVGYWSRGELAWIAARHCACLDDFVHLDGNGLYFERPPLPPTALLHIGARIYSWRRCARLVRGGHRAVGCTFSEQYRWNDAHRRHAVIRTRADLAKIPLN